MSAFKFDNFGVKIMNVNRLYFAQIYICSDITFKNLDGTVIPEPDGIYEKLVKSTWVKETIVYHTNGNRYIDLVIKAKEIAATTGATITFNDNVMEGTKDAHVIYTDVWVSMGEPDEVWNERISLLKDYQVDTNVMNNANPNAIFLHCLPSFHDLKTTIGQEINEKFGLKEMEVTDEVFRSNKSKVFDKAENRLHTIKAVMFATLRDK